MYVYFLQHARESRFKIGKANDVYRRFLALGGEAEYATQASYCIRLGTSERASRIERVLHKLFEPWNIPVGEGRRYEGDTEQFDSDCWARVARFIADNSDLTDGAAITPLLDVMRHSNVPVPRAHQLRGTQLSDAKRKKLAAAIARAKSEFDDGLREIEAGVDKLNSVQLRSCRISSNDGGRTRIILIETLNRGDFESLDEAVCDRWAGLSVRRADGQFGVLSIVPSVCSWESKFIRINLGSMGDEICAPYRDAFEKAIGRLRLY
ncbi:GIY-YIG nuclease family protein [Massilia orientalis]|uniref:GIY-YIG nuclease family protein n=1 Tax=Massilia orientalis TaxID=3050128 RepID=A0ACC7MD70_9BURK|nr:GIY-YIG nuclease family protein [Massilia sp. YIM B02787]